MFGLLKGPLAAGGVVPPGGRFFQKRERPLLREVWLLIRNVQLKLCVAATSNAKVSDIIIVSCNIIKIFRPVAQQSASKLPALPLLDKRKRQRGRECERETMRQSDERAGLSYALWQRDVCVITRTVASLLCGCAQSTRKLSLAILPQAAAWTPPPPHPPLFTRIAHGRLRASCSNFHYNYSICRRLKIHCVKEGRMGGEVLSVVATVNVAFMHYIITVVFALRHATTRGS